MNMYVPNDPMGWRGKSRLGTIFLLWHLLDFGGVECKNDHVFVFCEAMRVMLQR